ncbi:hypothetical protein ANCCEY_05488 [Ancylostoma ceylanicum]|uniref:SAM domain-containing protein n=1 Tax=Ancylostoma ceylanicum TaxID=53326 RepID=A0A0D6M6D6_9BILA|nr:hypothetical protein ANCCEY_05488 [Ancylostoma ceylanicum]
MVRKAIRSPLVANAADTAMPSEVFEWTTKDVSIWLHNAGFHQYADLFAVQHKIDGATLLMLSEIDLRDPPLQIKCLGDIKRLGRAIYDLKNSHINSMQTSPRVSESASQDDVLLCVEYDQRRKMSISGEDVFVRTKQSAIIDDAVVETLSNNGDIHSVRLISRDELIRTVESPDTKAKSLAKLLIAFLYCLSSLLITAFVMVLVHDRVPDMKMYPPLPDIVLDNLPLIPWAFDMCELIGVALSVIWFTSYGSLMDKLMQAFHIWSRLGMSIQGVRTCGDYMFSGHTTAITLLNHFITESTDDRIRLWFPLGWFFEAGSIGKVPNEFEMPLRVIIPRWCQSSHRGHDDKEKKEETKHEKEAKHAKKAKKKHH